MASTLITQTGILWNLDGLKDKVVQRLASSSNSCESFDCEETIWERGTLENGAEENVIRFRSTRTTATVTLNTIHVLLPAESIRLQPEFLVRTTIDLNITSPQPETFLSALGYAQKFTLYKRGIEFRRGTVKVELYQLFLNAKTIAPLDSTSFILVISCSVPEKNTSDVGIELSSQQMVEVAKERIRELRGVIRGLVDVSRVD